MTFLISFLFDTYIFFVVLQMVIKWAAPNYHNPFSDLIAQWVEPLAAPLRKRLPSIGGLELALIVLSLGLELIKLLLLAWLQAGSFPHPVGLIFWAIGALGTKVINVFFYALLIEFIMHWVPNLKQNVVGEIVSQITQPVLGMVRRFLPVGTGFDFSPIVGMIVLKLIDVLLFGYIVKLGIKMTF